MSKSVTNLDFFNKMLKPAVEIAFSEFKTVDNSVENVENSPYFQHFSEC